ncbi:hypothetical protein BSIN_5426 [Burkholderia singularis]|uniref:Uncharacterized protein n=1 Tax=Burkholderia singularis TaxID=1503053 RepID=A0A238HB90_9BURK|nr:hypothetical protein BSIN_5426 [Burkholderia singularis]
MDPCEDRKDQEFGVHWFLEKKWALYEPPIKSAALSEGHYCARR